MEDVMIEVPRLNGQHAATLTRRPKLAALIAAAVLAAAGPASVLNRQGQAL